MSFCIHGTRNMGMLLVLDMHKEQSNRIFAMILLKNSK